MLAQASGQEEVVAVLIVGIGIAALALAFFISLIRWLLRIDFRCDQNRQIIEALGRIEGRLPPPASS